MIKIFINVSLQNYSVRVNEFTKEYIDKLINLTKVETNYEFDTSDVVSLMLLDQADRLSEFLRMHNIDGQIGLIFNHSKNYYGWTLLIKTDNTKDTINPVVSRFFNWDRIENQSILSFSELMQ